MKKKIPIIPLLCNINVKLPLPNCGII